MIENSIAARLGDPTLAHDVYADLRDQVLRSSERRYNIHVTVTLAPWEHGPATGKGAMFVATVHWDYRATGLAESHRFVCVTDPREYQSLMRDPHTAEAWLIDPYSGLEVDPAEAFSLLDYTINDSPQPIHRIDHPGAAVFTVSGIPEPGVEGSHVSYTYQVLVPKHGHLLYLDIIKPSKGLRATLTHHNCGIHYITPLGRLASAHDPRIHRSPHPTSTIDVGFDGWIFPTDGITYAWSLNTEFVS